MITPGKTIRCAIYCRKSSEEGLQQEFNSLDAQREASLAYILSQRQEGWTCLPERYDDGGFSGGNLERPALQRLLTDIAGGLIDCVVVHKVDRLSRSLLDFARMMETFDKHRVSFVSVTQQFNTATSMGRLVLNVLLSFAQFEREIISERTRDKIAATRRKGKWSGGPPILGYDVHNMKLVINDEEAQRVRAIFELYLHRQALRAVVEELGRRGWHNKRWRTRQGHERGGYPFSKTSLQMLLTNVLYVGQTKYRSEVHPGEHQGIVDAGLWQQVQDLVRPPGRAERPRHASEALLTGLLRCRPCGRAMTPAHSTGTGSRRYRYYVCTGAQKLGWHTCPNPSVAAPVLEQIVLRQLSQDDVALQALLESWQSREPAEQARLLRLLIEGVEYGGGNGAGDKLAIMLRPTGSQRMADILAGSQANEQIGVFS
jgi:site-specific DNA recombinase